MIVVTLFFCMVLVGMMVATHPMGPTLISFIPRDPDLCRVPQLMKEMEATMSRVRDLEHEIKRWRLR